MNPLLKKEIQKQFPKNSFFQVDLKKNSYFHSGGFADCILTIENIDNLTDIIAFLRKKNLFFRSIGKGSNLLFPDKGVKEILLLNCTKKIEAKENQLEVTSDFFFPRVQKFCHRCSLLGFDFATGIPGTIGGAITMNAGTKLGEIKDIVNEIIIVDNNEIVIKKKKELNFSYRSSDIKKDNFIFSALFDLSYGTKEKVELQKEKEKKYLSYRHQTQPLTEYSFGSTFKNPIKTEKSAGYWIEKAGLKGYQIGEACISEKHANFIINLGKATTKNAISLIEYIQEIVYQKYQITLEREVKFF